MRVSVVERESGKEEGGTVPGADARSLLCLGYSFVSSLPLWLRWSGAAGIITLFSLDDCDQLLAKFSQNYIVSVVNVSICNVLF